MEQLKNWPKKKISLEELYDLYQPVDYITLVDIVTRAIQEGLLKPLKNSRTNGKYPSLAQQYWVTVHIPNKVAFEQELRFQLHPALQNTYYLRHLEQYEADRASVLALNQFWKKQGALLQEEVSLNERSFQIWQEEKFLQEGNGVRILKNLGLTLDSLKVYQTTEPLAYYSHCKQTPQNVLIVENKDTFYSMRRYLLAEHQSILGLSVGTLIYGAGKKIQKMVMDFSICAEPYLNVLENQFFYFGDLDYEGIAIYEGLRARMKEICELQVFTKAYQLMLKKAVIETLPLTKAGQQATEGENFFTAFSPSEQEKIKNILTARKYIPQEILTILDF